MTILAISISSGAKDWSEKVVRNCPHERIVEAFMSCKVPRIVGGRTNKNLWKKTELITHVKLLEYISIFEYSFTMTPTSSLVFSILG